MYVLLSINLFRVFYYSAFYYSAWNLQIANGQASTRALVVCLLAIGIFV